MTSQNDVQLMDTTVDKYSNADVEIGVKTFDKYDDIVLVDTQPGTKKWPQYLATILATLSGMCAGSVVGWTAPALPYLLQATNQTFEGLANQTLLSSETTNHVSVSEMQASWIGSLAPLGGLVGSIPAGFLAGFLGRKVYMLAMALPLLTGWILIILAESSVAYIYAGRFIGGLAIGGVTVVGPLYNEEIAEVEIRGSLGVFLDLMVTVGILWSYSIGALDRYFYLSISCSILPVLFFLTFVWMPESPVFLLSKGRTDEAKASLKWLRGAEDVDKELEEIQRVLLENQSCADDETTRRASILKWFSKFSYYSVTGRAAFIIYGLMAFQQLSGINAIVFYTVKIFEDSGSSLSPITATIIVGIIQVLATLTPTYLVDRLGRCRLLMCSGLGMSISLFILSIYLVYMKDLGENYGWMPFVLISGYIIFFSIGYGPIPWFMMAELLPNEGKGWVSGSAVCLNWSLSFFVTNIFDALIRSWGQSGTYVALGVVSVLGAVFAKLCVLETTGKTKEQIQNELRHLVGK